MKRDVEEQYLRRALRLARRGLGRTSPNPMVGAVVVKRGEIVGEGYHRRAGTDHAEVVALRAAGRAARGAELYVNLEPCSHFGLTPPCTQAIIDAGVKRVVVGMIDPNPLVNGKGLQILRRAGIEVRSGVLEAECLELNRAFRVVMQQGRPLVTFKAAATLDGRVATRTGHARWVTGEAARRMGHRLRNEHAAIVVGSGTVVADDPELTCRDVPGGRDPVRVIVDSRLRTPPTARAVVAARSSRAATWIFATARAPVSRRRALEAAGAQVHEVKEEAGRVSIRALLVALRELRIMSVLLEGGPRLAGAFWDGRLVDEVVLFVAPKVLGDPGALPLLAAGAVERMEDAVGLERLRVRRVGDDLMIGGRPSWAEV
ncbi:MAG: bifunctional diaminohydroxyphosphoribosylaminopyrimidine deaminase/5-amino-6-(5-phosphoribosylamino)uracil reductase RibD [Deltaproteobacteria bacterium]|nr:bifunctional diaminohydroxyphosphoribosylaminopyrimidine deaminase/5-amino-6-(5-phosphoribosylamino)uracil reductase RibD [Deltaproteobacteria bacterium]